MKLANIIQKGLYWPLCRAYARRLGDRPADANLRFLCGFQFWHLNHRWPNFVQPRSFSEQVWSLQLHGRDPRLTIISDKLRVRDYVASKAGNEYLVPLYWSGGDPDEIPFNELPQRFMLKTNHGCGFLLAVNEKASLDRESAKSQLREWLGVNYCRDVFLGIAWAYRNIPPKILVEALLEENGKPPTDYKFWCFGGRVECISLHFDRFTNHSTLSFDRDFEPGGMHFDLPTYQGTSSALRITGQWYFWPKH
ncbi:MAG: ATP-grasp fold amidoligase family protein [Verrucomicrobiota bacterium]